jgi:hypothetical protein
MHEGFETSKSLFQFLVAIFTLSLLSALGRLRKPAMLIVILYDTQQAAQRETVTWETIPHNICKAACQCLHSRELVVLHLGVG